jgi:TonB family protein
METDIWVWNKLTGSGSLWKPCRLRMAVCIGFVILAQNHESLGQTQTASDYQVESAYLYNFAKSTQWPRANLPEGSSSLVIGVVGGKDEFLVVLREMVAGKTIGIHPVTVRNITFSDDMKSCQLLFFSSSDRKRIQKAIAGLGQAGVLLVGEQQGFLQQGGMINLMLENGRINFEVNQVSLDQAAIHLNSKLLSLAKAGGDSPDVKSDSTRKLLLRVPPEYPEMAQRLNLTGTVQVEARVMPDGKVKDVKIVGGHPVLADAVMRAVMLWRYEPAPKESTVLVKVAFSAP